MKNNTNNKKVLIVEDNQIMAKCLADMVEFFDSESKVVADGELAIEELKDNNYSIVIADTHMPKISGFELLKYIKQNYPELPVAIISTMNTMKTQGLVVTGQPDFYLPKPLKSKDLAEILSKVK